MYPRRTITSAGLATFAAIACAISSLSFAGVNEWTALGPEGGPFYDVEFPPAADGPVYAVAETGFYRAPRDGGLWELTRADFSGAPLDVAVDPSNGMRVLVAAGGGIFLSEDGGVTFAPRGGGPDGVRIEFSRDGSTGYFGRGARIFRSDDRGQNWTERTPLPVDTQALIHAIEIDPADPRIVYATVFGSGIFVSQNGGDSWQLTGSAAPQPAGTQNFIVDPANPQRLLAATQSGLLVSNDRGVSWAATAITDAILDVSLDPFDPQALIVADSIGRLSKSSDGGATWAPLPPAITRLGVPSVRFDPARSGWVAAFGGNGVSFSGNGGANWVTRTAGLQGTSPVGFASRSSLGRNYFGIHDLGLFHVAPGGAIGTLASPATELSIPPGEASILRVMSLPGSGADILYVAMNGKLARSTNSGATWAATWPFAPAVPVTDVAAFPTAPQVVYAGTFDGVYKSIDSGANWLPSSSGMPAGFTIESLVVASESIVYARGYLATSNGSSPPTIAYSLFKSSNAGASWSSVFTSASPTASVSVDPRDPEVSYLSANGGQLLKSANGGATWTTLTSQGSPLCCSFLPLVFDPADPRRVYAPHASGLLRSIDDGATWEPLSPTQSGVPFMIFGAALDASDPNTVLIATRNAGVRTLTVAPDLDVRFAGAVSLTANAAAIYTLEFRNTGRFRASRVRITAQFPTNASAISATSANGTCTVSGNSVTCTHEILAPQATHAAMTISVTPTSAGAFSVSASISADEPDASTGNNTATSNLTVTAVPTPPPGGGSGGGGGGGFSFTWLALLLGAGLWPRVAIGKSSR